MFGRQAIRLLKEKWANATLLAEELYAMFQDDIPLTQNAPITINNRSTTQPAVSIFNSNGSVGGISIQSATGDPVQLQLGDVTLSAQPDNLNGLPELSIFPSIPPIEVTYPDYGLPGPVPDPAVGALLGIPDTGAGQIGAGGFTELAGLPDSLPPSTFTQLDGIQFGSPFDPNLVPIEPLPPAAQAAGNNQLQLQFPQGVTADMGNGVLTNFQLSQQSIQYLNATLTPASGGGGLIPIKITGGSGDTYTADAYLSGLSSPPTSISVRQLSIDAAEAIPVDTWWFASKDGTSSNYIMQFPVWVS